MRMYVCAHVWEKVWDARTVRNGDKLFLKYLPAGLKSARPPIQGDLYGGISLGFERPLPCTGSRLGASVAGSASMLSTDQAFLEKWERAGQDDHEDDAFSETSEPDIPRTVLKELRVLVS